MVSKIFPNSLYILFVLTLGSILLSMFADDSLAKAAFIGATSLSAGMIGLGMVFIQNQRAKGWSWIGAFNFNVWACITFAMVALASVFTFQDTSVFTDVVFEAVIGGTASAGVGLAMGFAKKDSGDDE